MSLGQICGIAGSACDKGTLQLPRDQKAVPLTYSENYASAIQKYIDKAITENWELGGGNWCHY